MDIREDSIADPAQVQQGAKEISRMVQAKKNGYSWKSGRPYNPRGRGEEQEAFREEGIKQSANGIRRRVRILFCDEMRYGLISNHRRGWSKRGKQRPLIPYGMDYEFGYIYIGIDIESWQLESLLLPDADSLTTKVFIDYLREEYGNEEVIVIWDGAGFHRSWEVKGIEGVRFVRLPAYSPELNPVERLIEELRKSTANKVFNNLGEVEEVLIEALKEYIHNREKVESLCGFSWIKKQMEEIRLTS